MALNRHPNKSSNIIINVILTKLAEKKKKTELEMIMDQALAFLCSSTFQEKVLCSYLNDKEKIKQKQQRQLI